MDSFQGITDRVRRIFSVLLDLQPTLECNQVPKLFREPGLTSGYRKPNQPFHYYLISLFQLHNETFNVWTHILGFFVVWITMAEYHEILDFWTNKHSWAMLVLGVCVLIASFVSSCVHLFHSKSENWHYNAFLIDYIGAVLYAYGSGVMAFYVSSDRQMYFMIESFYFPVLWFYSLFNFACLSYAKLSFGHDICSRKRKYIMVGAMAGNAILLTVPMGPRYIKCLLETECPISSLNHLTVVYLLFGLQAFFFASHFPEVMIPGKIDIFGHSHQIFHVFSTICQCAQFNCIYKDIRSGNALHGNPDLPHLVFSTVMLIICQMVVLVVLRRMVSTHSQEQKLK